MTTESFINGTLTKWLKIAIEVGILLFAVGIAWSTLRVKVETNTKDIVKHDKRIYAAEQDIDGVNGNIIEIKTMQKVTLDNIREIKEELKK